MRRLALVPLTVGILLFPSAASALGLGEIEMQSALNQRLDAEIPLRGVAEDDTDRIIVSLASEEAFREVGLQRQFALTRLQFRVRQHDDGRHYVHVTSREPIVEPFLSFLIEIDWPDGNLLREYTVLLDPPVFVSEREEEPTAVDEAEAPAAADEESMTATGVPADIERDTETAAAEPEPEPEAEPAPEPEPESKPEPAADTEPAPDEASKPLAGDFSDTPVFLQVEQAEERAEAEALRAEEELAETEPEPEPVTATATGYDTGPGEYGPVERGENLWNIAAQLKRDDMTVQQMMLALLRYNPDAFVDDNINRLRQGYVLRVPTAEDVLSLSAQQAVARVREHNTLWREFRTAARSDATTAAEQLDASADADVEAAGEDGGLKIVASDEGAGASTDESASATTDSSAGQDEDLKLAREQLESARMEKAELESRVDELEETVSKMERLIEVREDQLARLQDQLQKVQQGEEIDESVLDEADAGTDEMEPSETDEATGAEEPVAEEAPESTEVADDEDEETDEVVAAADSDGDAGTEDTGETAGGDEDAQAAAGDGEIAESDEQRAATESAQGAEEGESGVVTVRTQPQEPDWLDRVGAFWNSVRATVGGLLAGAGLGALMANPLALPVAGGALVLLLLGGLLLARRRRAGGEDEVLDDGGQVAFAGGMTDDDQFSAMLQSESGDDVAVEEDVGGFDEGDDTLAFGAEDAEEAESALMSEEFDLDNLEEEDRDEQAMTAADASEDETIAEADVYLAYGLHQQAEDLLKLALQEQPDRLDYHAKMLETLYGAGKTKEFIDSAETFQSKVGDPGDRLWLQTVAMGKELAPDNPLFQQQVDEALKPAESAATHPPETDFEIGGEEEDATDLDFSFEEDSEQGGGDEQDDDTFARTVMLDSDDFETKEGDSGLVGPGEQTGTAGGVESADEDELDFDLEDFSLDTSEEPAERGAAEPETASMATAETGSSGADEDLEFDLSDLDLEEDESGSPATADSGDDSGDAGEVEFDLGDLEMDDDESSLTAAGDTLGSESELADMDTGGLEDLEGEIDETLAEEAAGADSLDFDPGDFDLDTGETEDGGDATATLETADDISPPEPESDLSVDEPAGSTAAAGTEFGETGDEDDFDTMIDLARAYIDMGDAESARATLEEVAQAGNEKQRSEAQSLLGSV